MFVYLIGSSDGYCKIGSAKNSASRLSQLDGTKLPFELTLLAEVVKIDLLGDDIK